MDKSTSADEIEKSTSADEIEKSTSADEIEKSTSADEIEKSTSADEIEKSTSADEIEKSTSADEIEKSTSADEIEKSTSADEIENPPIPEPSTSNKKLVILDLDQTIIDIDAPNEYVAKRPHLDELMEIISQHFDLAVWSATPLYIVEDKLVLLGFFEKPTYKLAFYMGRSAMTPTMIDNKPLLVKSLKTVWDRYPQYNKHNTIICDDKPLNFALNVENGIEIEPYTFELHFEDNELELLGRYLSIVATVDDVTTLNNQAWKKYVAEPVQEQEPESEPQ